MNDLLPDIGERLFGRPHLIEPAALQARMNSAAWRRVLTGEKSDGGAREVSIKKLRNKRLAAIEADRVRVANGSAEYAITPEGVAVVPVLGVLMARSDWFTALCGWTTYEGLSAIFDSATREPRVRAILMDVESPGGEAAGMIDVADLILAARSQKPVWAVANSYAFSAAYAIAASAERLFVPRLCQVGSIGAVAVYTDQTEYDKSVGLRYTAIYSGARKMDGWSHAALSDDARAAAQASIDHCRDEFAALVGRQGRMSAKAAADTQAAVYHDREAVAAKLADRVGTFEDALFELSGGQRPGAEILPFSSAPGRAVAAGASPARSRAGPETFREFAGDVADLCTIAGLPGKTAVDLAFKHENIAQVRHEIIEERAAADEALGQINNHSGMMVRPNPETAWDKTVDELNKRPPG